MSASVPGRCLQRWYAGFENVYHLLATTYVQPDSAQTHLGSQLLVPASRNGESEPIGSAACPTEL
jgi:hypothetical protein